MVNCQFYRINSGELVSKCYLAWWFHWLASHNPPLPPLVRCETHGGGSGNCCSGNSDGSKCILFMCLTASWVLCIYTVIYFSYGPTRCCNLYFLYLKGEHEAQRDLWHCRAGFEFRQFTSRAQAVSLRGESWSGGLERLLHSMSWKRDSSPGTRTLEPMCSFPGNCRHEEGSFLFSGGRSGCRCLQSTLQSGHSFSFCVF